MARSKKGEATIILLLALLGGVVWLFDNHPVVAVFLIIVVVGVLVAAAVPRTCGVCGVSLKRVAYRWEIDGQMKRVCPNCNRTLERRQSNRALGNP